MAILAINFTPTKRSKLAYVLCILHFVCAGCGIAFFGLGIYIKIRLLAWLKLIDGYNDNLLPLMMVVVGTLLVVIDVAGARLVSTAPKSTRVHYLLIPYLAIMFILSICILAAGIICFVHQRHLSQAFHRGLINAMQRYKDNSTLKSQIDFVQMKFECCGNLGYEDWFDVQWVNNKFIDLTDPEVESKMTNGQFLNDDVPFSCCSPEVARHCIHHHIHDNNMHYNYDYKADLTIFTDGCKKKLMNYYRFRLGNVGAIVLSMFAIQLCLLFGVRILQTAVYNSAKDPDADSKGYLFDKGAASEETDSKARKSKTKDVETGNAGEESAESAATSGEEEHSVAESGGGDSFDSDSFDSPEEHEDQAPAADGGHDAHVEREEPVYANVPFHEDRERLQDKLDAIRDNAPDLSKKKEEKGSKEDGSKSKKDSSKKESSKSKSSKKDKSKSSSSKKDSKESPKKDSKKSSKKDSKKSPKKDSKKSPKKDSSKSSKKGATKSPKKDSKVSKSSPSKKKASPSPKKKSIKASPTKKKPKSVSRKSRSKSPPKKKPKSVSRKSRSKSPKKKKPKSVSRKSRSKSPKKKKPKKVKSPRRKTAKVKSPRKSARKSPRKSGRARKSKMKNRNNNILEDLTNSSDEGSDYSSDDDLLTPLLSNFYSSSDEEELYQGATNMAPGTMATSERDEEPTSEEEVTWLLSRTQFYTNRPRPSSRKSLKF